MYYKILVVVSRYLSGTHSQVIEFPTEEQANIAFENLKVCFKEWKGTLDCSVTALYNDTRTRT